MKADRMSGAGPRKLLALDGGGIRGALTLEILAAIESAVRTERHDENVVLADYFDYIGGTSTGAIIAAGLALGMPVSELRDIYEKHGKEMFDKAFILDRYRYKFDSERLQRLMQQTFGEHTTFGDDALKTLLMVVLRNATTDSPWPLSNNPNAKYNEPARPDCNLKFPLWQLVRASTAAPTYFPPELIDVGGHQFVYVDGGVTMYNNPAFQLFLMATLGAYRLGWPTGEDKMLLVSVGTGTAAKSDDTLRPGQMNLLYNAKSIPAALMSAALNEQDLLCRVFGRCRHGEQIDRELGYLIDGKDTDPAGLPGERMFTYMRYNADLSKAGLMEIGLPKVRPEDVQKLDSVDHIKELQEIGQRVAKRDVKAADFAGFL
ncbi:patatin-like phospholipase family protein [Mycobacterium sp. OTB74]|uniref:patatin-like phospholipase family protein n=1 Tax=Mycobacterium sp. OTB74 TaxID=1853452 RepID=UPI00247404A0|nr:patatin-like phospholipase family protein [Mycobacterium sp. OTB74]MDH6247508.1 patatin-like phospholipase/acyl hydrolase [Mycobacterium sp. OTB74]